MERRPAVDAIATTVVACTLVEQHKARAVVAGRCAHSAANTWRCWSMEGTETL
ncbi:Putative calcium-dependent protein kinase family protein [Zea mays]|uniref:Putative calcium-dependent protein kinase family protein n=1 Tax=Zea mays TaxID=4577 RepID=A0A1D6G9R4_MAIZE|nr:Putative calcium-dependent protein kinase family protein [Zea mays]